MQTDYGRKGWAAFKRGEARNESNPCLRNTEISAGKRRDTRPSSRPRNPGRAIRGRVRWSKKRRGARREGWKVGGTCPAYRFESSFLPSSSLFPRWRVKGGWMRQDFRKLSDFWSLKTHPTPYHRNIALPQTFLFLEDMLARSITITSRTFQLFSLFREKIREDPSGGKRHDWYANSIGTIYIYIYTRFWLTIHEIIVTAHYQ